MNRTNRINYLCYFALILLMSCGDKKIPKKEDKSTTVPIAAAVSAKDISGKLDQYVAFSELLNLIRFYYPGDEAVTVNWENFALMGMKRIEQAGQNELIEDILSELFLPIAPSLMINSITIGQTQPSYPNGYTFWRHQGFNFGYSWNDSGFSFYDNRRLTVTDPQDSIYFPVTIMHEQILQGGLEIAFPKSIAVENGKTMPIATGFNLDESNTRYNRKFTDLYVRLAAAANLWGVFQHFFPYMQDINVDWPAELPKLLHRAGLNTNIVDLVHTFKLSTAKLQDNHNFYSFIGGVYYTSPFGLDWIESKPVVTEVYAEAQGLVARGFILTHIDNVPVENMLAELDATTTTSDNKKREMSVYALLKRPTQTALYRFEDHEGNLYEYELAFSSQHHWNETLSFIVPKPENDFFEIEPGIFYLDLIEWQGTTDAEDQIIEQLISAQGVVIDWRGYPIDHEFENRVVATLCPEEIRTPPFIIKYAQEPNNQSELQDESGWSTLPALRQSNARVAVITGRNTQSAADTGAARFQSCSRATLVGEATSGANGNITGFHLFGRPENGGLLVNFSGMRVLQNDRSRLLGVGVQPDLLVQPTIIGVTDQNDESLQKALELLRVN